MAVQGSRTVAITGDIRVSDLRELVLNTEGAPADAHVEIRGREWSNHPTDHVEARIAVTWEAS